jgi:hypothetical protein
MGYSAYGIVKGSNGSGGIHGRENAKESGIGREEIS